jgi:hypothetical protein
MMNLKPAWAKKRGENSYNVFTFKIPKSRGKKKSKDLEVKVTRK